jgi:hypothetical protein
VGGPIEKAGLGIAPGCGALVCGPVILAKLEQGRLRAARLAGDFKLLTA